MDPGEPRTGWAADMDSLAHRRAEAAGLIGKRITRVAYVNIDYRGWDLGYRDEIARRKVTDVDEWQVPTWDAGTFHHLDFGVELTLDCGGTRSVTWDPPGMNESLRLQEGPVSERGAVWDVTETEPWRTCLTSQVTGVELRYHPWGDHSDGFWCTRISIGFGPRGLELLLGDLEPESGGLAPSADSVAVVWGAALLPSWERTDDLV
jgi:hypothetical protein